MQAGFEFAARLVAHFGAARGEQGALAEAVEPAGAPVGVLGAQHVFAKTKVPAQGLGNVGIGGGQLGKQGQQFGKGGTLAAMAFRQTPARQAQCVQLLDDVGQAGAGLIRFGSPGENVGKERAKRCSQLFIAGRRRCAPEIQSRIGHD